MLEPVNLRPFANGHGMRTAEDTIVCTFPQTTDMNGWKMTHIEIDESGYFFTVTWTKLPESEIADGNETEAGTDTA